MSEYERDVSHLPKMDDEPFTAVWSAKRDHAVVRAGLKVLTRCASYFECFPVFEGVAADLETRYGGQVEDFRPTESSLLELGGDDIFFHSRLEKIREGFRKRHRVWLEARGGD
jgi:hypothetical protein